jgi:signal transduction histidine kinase
VEIFAVTALPADVEEFQLRLAELAVVLDEQAVLLGGLEAAAAGMRLDVSWLARAEDETKLVIRHLSGDRTGALRGLVLPRGWGLCGKTFAAARPFVVNDYFSAADITHQFDGVIAAEGLERLISAPIVIDERVIAVLAGGPRGAGAFGDVAIGRMEVAASQISTALRAAGRARQLAEVAVEQDRGKMATSLHDSVGAMLFAIQAGVRELSGALEDQSELRAKAETIEAQAIEATRALRESLLAMSAPARGLALEVELRDDCDAFQQRTGIATSFVLLDEHALVLDGARAEALIGAAREALVNVERHANATAVVITLARTGGVVQLTVTNDGFGSGVEGDGAGLGLAAQGRRFARLGGDVTLRRLDEGGAVLRARLPIIRQTPSATTAHVAAGGDCHAQTARSV